MPMERVRLLVAPVAVAAALLVAAAPASANKFTFGVSAGDVTSSSAVLWAHTQGASKVGLILQKGNKAQQCPQADVLPKPRTQAKSGRDNTVHMTKKKLQAGSKYAFRFCLPGGKSSALGKFNTA